MRTLLLVAGLALSLPVVSAQPSAFRPGYVVLAEGDTLRGEVQDAPDFLAARGVTFRDSETGTTARYTPETARAHGTLTGRRFVQHPLASEHGAAPEALFAQLIASGAVDLYRAEVREGEWTFFVHRDEYEAPRGLYETHTLAEQRQATALFREVHARYRGTLAVAFYDCPEMHDRVEGVQLRERDLVRVVEAYNACVGSGPSAPLTRERRGGVAFSLSPRLGAGVGYLSGRRNRNLRYGEPTWRATPQGALPYVGLQVEAVLLNLPARTSIVGEVAYQRKGQAPDGFRMPDRSNMAADDLFGTHYGVGSLGVRYALGNSGKPTAYLGAGVVNGYVFDAPEKRSVWSESPPRTEAGMYAEIGTSAVVSGAPYALGLRVERTSIGAANPLAGLIYDYSLDNRYNTAVSFVLSRRFGR